MTKVMRRPILEVIDKGAVTKTHPVPLLFVHGACHSAWCWDEHFLDYFAEQGYRAMAVSLRGHGRSSSDKSLNRCSMVDFVDDVEAVATLLDTAPVLVGHSMGGFIVQKVLANRGGPGGVLLASIPPRGLVRTSLRIMRTHPVISLRANISGRPEMIFKQPMTRETLFSPGTPQAIIDVCVDRLETESRRALWFDAMVPFRKPDNVSAPILVLGAEHDRSIAPTEIYATARAYRTEAEIFPGMGHNMMLEAGWPAVAGRIESWLGERGL